MPDYQFDVPRLRDRDLFKFFCEVSSAIGSPHITVAERGSNGGQTIATTDRGEADKHALATSPLFSISSASTHADGIGVSINRHAAGADSTSDRLSFSNSANVQQVGRDVVRRVNELIDKHFVPGPEPFTGLFHNQKTFTSLIKSHQQMLVGLQSTATNIAEQLAAARLSLEQEFAERRLSLEEEFQKRHADGIAALDEQRSLIFTQEEDLRKRTLELDDRDHIHARRQLREQITSNISKRLEGSMVPYRTSFIGWIVFSLTLTGSIFLGIISYLSLTEFTEIVRIGANSSTSVQMKSDIAAVTLANSSVVWFLLARGAVAGIGSIAFLVYAISWLKSIYHADIRAHRDLERYSIDLNRASWAVETIMEAKAGDGAIPDILIAGMSRNLFDGSSSEGAYAAATNDALGSLLRASAKAKIGPSGAEFELNSRGANRIASQLSE